MHDVLVWLGLPVAASAHAGEVDRILALVHWLMVLLFVGWGSFFVYVLIRFRRGRNPRASYEGARGRFASAVEVGVLVSEIVLLARSPEAARLLEERLFEPDIARSAPGQPPAGTGDRLRSWLWDKLAYFL